MSTDMAMYGVEDVNAFFENAKRCPTYRMTGGYMIVAGLMSDAQEMMAFGDVEGARQTLNRAKYLQFKMVAGDMDFVSKREAA
jgi:hypothetical protein